ncbi:SrfA family protein [Halomonas saccharevitans]|nr:SrfA family protein [Halomonas saccharevitans]
MSAILLHSGKIEQFRALGETGQPAYHSALQLRKVISRRLSGRERHLAIPQRDQQGEGVDWYSGIPGDVVPWRSATEGEREDARIQLEAFRKEILAVEPPAEGQSGDHEVFTRLVKWVCHFPDENFVYLVDGTPVMTFWGFTHPDTDRHANPLQCLYPSASPEPAHVSPVPLVSSQASPEPDSIAAPVALPWWRRWWWWLLLALAVGLLLFGIKACTSFAAPDLAPPSLEGGDTSASFPQSLWSGRNIWPFNLWSSDTPSLQVAPSLELNGGMAMSGLGEGGLPETGLPTVLLPDMPELDTGLSSNEPALPANVPVPDTTPDAPGLRDDVLPPEIPLEGQATPPLPAASAPADLSAMEPLSLPTDAPDGSAEFLDGNWRGAGVMDSQNGRPLQVTYVFEHGEGHMYIQRGGRDGVTCAGPVTATMQGGTLQVEAQQKARCEDGSHYEMPRMQCLQANGQRASCSVGYDDAFFPMQLRKAS